MITVNFIFIIRGKTGSGKTTLVNKFAEHFKFEKIIIDEIKKIVEGKENRTERIFKTAGKQANKLLKKGHGIIVEEAFLKKDHIKLFFQMIEQKEKYHIQYILLECSKETAIERKTNLKPEIVNGQHNRTTEEIDPNNELVINTENRTSEEVFREILKINILL